MVCLPWADSDQCFNVSDAYFRWLFRMTVSDACFRLLFRITVPDEYFGCLFQMTFRDDCSEWVFRMPISDDFSTTDSYFSDQFVFPRSIPTAELWPWSPPPLIDMSVKENDCNLSCQSNENSSLWLLIDGSK